MRWREGEGREEGEGGGRRRREERVSEGNLNNILQSIWDCFCDLTHTYKISSTHNRNVMPALKCLAN